MEGAIKRTNTLGTLLEETLDKELVGDLRTLTDEVDYQYGKT